jgi:hypothetical protein
VDVDVCCPLRASVLIIGCSLVTPLEIQAARALPLGALGPLRADLKDGSQLPESIERHLWPVQGFKLSAFTTMARSVPSSEGELLTC